MIKGKVIVQQIQGNLFQFTFGYDKDKACIFDKRPCSFNGALLAFKKWDNGVPLSNITFNSIAFYVNIYAIPKSVVC